jgi:glycosyltransferase involved in cell wall biosynthesis
MNITCITATAPGREKFLARCRHYVSRFKVQPDEHLVVSSTNMKANLLEMLEKAQGDVVAFIEDDDWYHPEYLGDMVDRLSYSRRALIGYDPTMYYHIKHEGYRILPHKNRASLYTTVGLTNVVYSVLADVLESKSSEFVDIALWRLLQEVSVTTVGHLAIGIKHGFVKTEGGGHNLDKSTWFRDEGGLYLKKLIGDEDAEFYRNLAEDHRAGKF